MGTLIDELFVRIGLDADGFDKENAKVLKGFQRTKDSASDSLKTIEGSAKKTADYLATVKTEVIGLFLAFAGAKSVTGFILDTINATAQVGRMGSVFGQNANTIHAWGDAFERAGGQADDAQRVFGKITGMIAEFKMNPHGLLSDGRLGQLSFKSAKEFQDPEEVLLHLADNFQQRMAAAAKSNDPKGAKMEQESMFRKMVSEKFGLSDNDIFLIEKGRDAITKQVEAFKVQDRVTEADTQAAQEFNDALVDLKKTMTGITRGPLMDLIKQLDHLAGKDWKNDKGGITANGKNAYDYFGDWIGGKAGASIKRTFGQEGSWTKYARGDNGAPAGAPRPAAGVPPVPDRGPELPSSSSGRGHTLADRNNNPGNIVDGGFARHQPGYAGHRGRFAVFDSPEHGIAAQETLLHNYIKRGINTPRKIAHHWAPAGDGDNNPETYAQRIAGWLGIGSNDQIGHNQVTQFAQKQAVQEGWHGNLHRLGAARHPAAAAHTKRGDGHAPEHAGAPTPWHMFRPPTQAELAAFSVHARQQVALHGALHRHHHSHRTLHQDNRVSVQVTVNGASKSSEHVGREIANSVHKNLKKRSLAVHANTGLD